MEGVGESLSVKASIAVGTEALEVITLPKEKTVQIRQQCSCICSTF